MLSHPFDQSSKLSHTTPWPINQYAGKYRAKKKQKKSITVKGANVRLPNQLINSSIFLAPNYHRTPFNVSGKVDANQVDKRKKKKGIKFNAGTQQSKDKGKETLYRDLRVIQEENGWRW